MTEANLGRNAPCWCGSGKKYKKCHLAADLAAAVERNAPLVPRARDILEIRDGILAPRQVRSDEIGSSRR
jgi:methionyl aminopeptidase